MSNTQKTALDFIIERERKYLLERLYRATKQQYTNDGGITYYNNKYCLSNENKRLLQQQVIINYLPTRINNISLLRHLQKDNESEYIQGITSFIIKMKLEEIEEKIGFEVDEEIIEWISKNLNKANYKRYARIREKTQDIVENNKGYFITLTFKDSILESTNAQTRRKYATRILKSVSIRYIGNKDYGDLNEREHYHAIIESDTKPNLSYWIDNYGFVKIQKIRDTENDAKRVARYTSKLTYHAIKQTTKNERIIYSKCINLNT